MQYFNIMYPLIGDGFTYKHKALSREQLWSLFTSQLRKEIKLDC